MSDPTPRPGRGHWFALPCDLLREMEAAGLDAPAMILNVAAWTYTALNMTDGIVTTREAARLPCATSRRRQALEATGFWHTRGDGQIELVGYLDFNDTRERIQSRQAKARARQQRVRDRAASDQTAAEAEPGDDGPRHAEHHAARHAALPSPSPSPSPKREEENVDDGPDVQEGAVGDECQATPETVTPTPCRPRRRSDDDPSSDRDRIRRRERDSVTSGPAMPRWEDKPWEPVRDNWEARGLTYEPSAAQRRKLWPILVEFPEEVGDWVAEAPVDDSCSYGVVGHVLAAAAAERLRGQLPALFAALSEEERTRWLDEERGWPGIFTNPLAEARLTGEGLPTVALSENPFHVALPAMLKEREDVRALMAKMRRTKATTEDAGNGPAGPPTNA